MYVGTVELQNYAASTYAVCLLSNFFYSVPSVHLLVSHRPIRSIGLVSFFPYCAVLKIYTKLSKCSTRETSNIRNARRHTHWNVEIIAETFQLRQHIKLAIFVILLFLRRYYFSAIHLIISLSKVVAFRTEHMFCKHIKRLGGSFT